MPQTTEQLKVGVFRLRGTRSYAFNFATARWERPWPLNALARLQADNPSWKPQWEVDAPIPLTVEEVFRAERELAEAPITLPAELCDPRKILREPTR